MTFEDPDKIIHEIGAQPILQRPIFSRRYTGLDVTWTLSIGHVERRWPRRIVLLLKSSSTSDAAVWCSVKASDYPMLSLTSAGETGTVQGRIASVDNGHIWLSAATLQFPAFPRRPKPRSRVRPYVGIVLAVLAIGVSIADWRCPVAPQPSTPSDIGESDLPQSGGASSTSLPATRPAPS
jgi:hypothetical protein